MAIISNENVPAVVSTSNWNGSAMVQQQSFGTSGFTNHGHGQFTISFSTNFGNTSYGFYFGTSGENTNGNRGANGGNIRTGNKAVGSCRIDVYFGSMGGTGGHSGNATNTCAFVGTR